MMLSKIPGKINRRGSFLAFLTILDIGYGFGLIADKPNANLLLPWDTWGWIWIGFGLFIATGIFAKMDLWQFGAAAVLKTTWGILYLDLWIVRHLDRGWVVAIIWLSFAATVI